MVSAAAGVSLDDALSQRRLDFDDWMRLAESLSAALSALHTAGFVHRDVRCVNIYRNPQADGFLLGAFGVGLVRTALGETRSTREVGPWSYAGPEAIRAKSAESVIPAADVYSLGVVLYRAATGGFPFSPYLPSVAHDHVHATPPNPASTTSEIPKAAARLVLRALRKHASRRFRDGAHLARAIARARREISRSAPFGGAVHRSRRIRLGLRALAVIAGTLIVGAILAPRGSHIAIESDPDHARFSIYRATGSATAAAPTCLGTTPGVATHLKRGHYLVRVEKDGFLPWESEISVPQRAEAAPLRAQLAPACTLRVDSEPRGALARLVPLDGSDPVERVGNTPIEIESLEPGRYEIRLEKRGFSASAETVSVHSGRLTFAQPMRRISVPVTLRLFTNPPHASVEINGTSLPMTAPCEIPGLIAGDSAAIRVSKTGYATQDTTIQISASAPHQTLRVFLPSVPDR